jgi:type IV pilus assembly protein PilV
MNAHRRPPALPRVLKRRQVRESAGFVLIEVLVSILIFVFGLLAVVGLQANMIRAQTSAKMRGDATFLANEIVGVMWGDIGQLTNYDTASSRCSGYARCSTWLAEVAAALPGGTAAVVPDPVSGQVQITLSWTVPGEDPHAYTTQTNVHPAN